MPPGCGVGMSSIPRESSLPDLLSECKRFHRTSNCNKPSQDPLIAAIRDLKWQRDKPQLFFTVSRHLEGARKVRESGQLTRCWSEPKGLSTVTKAVCGGSTYVDLLKKQMGQG